MSDCPACADRGWSLLDGRIDVCGCGRYDPPKWVKRGDAACVVTHRKDPDRPRRAACGFYCAGHRYGVERMIAELPELYDDLGAALAGSGGGGEKIKSSHEPGLALNRLVVDARDEIHAELVRLVRRVAEEREVDVPADTVPALAVWLVAQVDWLAEQSDADETHDYLDRLTREAKSRAFTSGRRRFPIGVTCGAPLWCDIGSREVVRCEGRLVALLMPDDDRENLSEIVCESCGYEMPLRAAEMTDRWGAA